MYRILKELDSLLDNKIEYYLRVFNETNEL